MDRLKGLQKSINLILNVYLHSSMDRLKGTDSQIKYTVDLKFTFQYG